MKTMRKIASLLLALVMIFGLATTAFAAGNSITVNNAKSGETYSVYKMFDLKVNDENDPTAYTYTVNPAWAAFFAEGGAGAAYVTIDNNGYVTIADEATAANLAKAAAAWAGKPDETTSVEAAGETVVLSGLDNGYWLITSTLGTFAMTETTPDKNAVSVNEKNPEDTITKEVKEDSTNKYGPSNDAQIGDTVEFKSIATLIPGTRNVKIHDTMEKGLTFNADSVVIDGLNAGADKDYTVVVSPEDGHTFDIIFNDTYINGLEDTANLTITYSAVLNENAVANNKIDDQTNTIKITYGDKQSLEAETTTSTHKFSVFKHAKDSNKNLAGAVFSLKKNGVVVNLIKIDDNNYRVAKADETGVTTFTTVPEGDIVIWGVDSDDDYTLEETTAPEGYNKLAAEVNVTVDADNDTRIDVENKTGTELPSTGGMGTTLIYALGGILVLAAVILLVTKKRMASN